MNAPTTVALILQETPVQDPDAPASPFGGLMVPVLIIMALFYMIMLGPERKQRKKREAMLAELKKGQKVMTTGGMYGTIAAVNGDVISLQVSDGVRVRFSRSSIQGLTDGEKSSSSAKGDKQSSDKQNSDNQSSGKADKASEPLQLKA